MSPEATQIEPTLRPEWQALTLALIGPDYPRDGLDERLIWLGNKIDAIYGPPGHVINAAQKAALASLALDTGIFSITRSTVRVCLDNNNVGDAMFYWLKWVNRNGQPDEGMRLRRQREVILYTTGVLDGVE